MLTYIKGIDVAFINALMEVENSIRAGWTGGRWYPHKSPEGGTPTIAYGHKLTKDEHRNGRFNNGITELEAINLMMQHLHSKYQELQRAWNNTQDSDFQYLPKKYQYVLLDLVYNIGINKVYRDGSWRWPRLAQAIADENDQIVYEQSLRWYTKPNGKKVRLTSRSNKICEALGLDFKKL